MTYTISNEIDSLVAKDLLKKYYFSSEYEDDLQISGTIPSDFVPDICIYHNVTLTFPCPDGLASAYVAFKRYGEIDFLGLTYDQEIPDLSDYQNILVVDFSFSVDNLAILKSQGKTVYIIDHHQAFKERLQQRTYSFDNLIFDNKESGASLTWKALFPGVPVPLYIQYIRDRDLFTKALEYSDEIHAAMGTLKRSFALYEMLESLDDYELVDFLKPIGSKSLAKKYEKIHKCLDKVEFWQDIPVISLNSSTIYLKSDIGEFICKRYPFALFCLILNKSEPESIRLRSTKATYNTNLLRVFKNYIEISGHCNASNFKWEYSQEDLKTFVVSRYEFLKSLL